MEPDLNEILHGMSLDETTLFKLLNDKIRSKEFEGAKTAALIYLELKELKNDNLAPGNYKAKIAQLLEPAELKLRLLNFSWLDFLNSELKSGPEAHIQSLNEIAESLFEVRQLTLWNTIQSPKIFIKLLDLGANPFEHRERTVQMSRTTQTIPHFTVKSAVISEAKKIKLIQLLVARKQLDLAPCGLHHQPLPFLCLNDPNLKYLFPFIAKAEGIENERYQVLNLVHYICKHEPARKDWFNFLDEIPLDPLAKMLTKQDNKGKQGLLYLLKKLEKLSSHLLNAIDLLLKSNMVLDTTCRLLIEHAKVGASEWIVQNKFTMKKTLQIYDKVASEYAGKRKLDASEAADITKYGNSEFPFHHLPPELALMVCKDLDTVTIVNLFFTCKSVRERQDLFAAIAPEKFQREFPLIYADIESKGNLDWQLACFAKHSRRSANWSQGRFSWKKIALNTGNEQYLEKLTLKDLDENWLLYTDSRKSVKLWNVHERTIHETGITAERPYEVGKIISGSDGSSSALPIFGYFGVSQLTIHRNNRMHHYAIRTFPRAQFGTFIEPIGNNSILATNGAYIFDMEAEKVIGVGLHDSAQAASYNPFMNVIALAADYHLCLVDKRHGLITAELRPRAHTPYKRSNVFAVKFVDEYKVVLSTPVNSTVFDVRMQKELLSTKTDQLLRGINKHGRTIVKSPKVDLGVIWNFSRLEWEHVIHLPENCTTQLCNSRYAIFCHEDPNSKDSVYCLDFGDLN